MKKKQTRVLAKRAAPGKIQKGGFSQEALAIVRQQIAPTLTDVEFKVFLGVCNRYQADPIMKDIVPVIYNTKNGRSLQFIITRNFLLKRVQGNGLYDGLSTEIIRDTKDRKKIIGAKSTLWLKGMEHPIVAEVDFSEYYNDKNELWGRYPGAMISKVAESIVLKKGGGLCSFLTSEEYESSLDSIGSIKVPKVEKKFIVSDAGKVTEAEIKEKPGKKHAEQEVVNL